MFEPLERGQARQKNNIVDPYQYYPPSSSEGTYVVCVTHTGQPYLYYSEPNVTTVAGAAVWVQGKGIVVQGAPNMPVCQVTDQAVKHTKKKKVPTTTCTLPPHQNKAKAVH